VRADPRWCRISGSGRHHPQTNGKLEARHETLRARLKLLVYTTPEIVRAAMADFIRLTASPIPTFPGYSQMDSQRIPIH